MQNPDPSIAAGTIDHTGKTLTQGEARYQLLQRLGPDERLIVVPGIRVDAGSEATLHRVVVRG